MKNYHKIFFSLALGAATMGVTSCDDFEEVNTNPMAAQADQVEAYFALNKSILDAQQSPHEAERIFVYNWKSAARFHQMNHFAQGTYSDDYMSDYHNSRITSWMKTATLAMNLADAQIESGKVTGKGATFVNNVKQAARIWYAYLTSEYVDCFGVGPTGMVFGEVPEFKSAKEVYLYMLSELKDAASQIDTSITPSDLEKTGDPAYAFDFSKWVKYANSMRLRLAMRLSEAEPATAKSEFEAVDKTMLITAADEIFKVAEKDVWDNLAGVMSRSWNQQCVSATIFNLMTGLGGVPTASQLTADRYQPYIKSNPNYVGLYFPEHFSPYTDNPSKGLWMDGIPYSVDPRAFKLFYLPEDKEAENYSSWGEGNYSVRNKENVRGLIDLENPKDTVAFVRPAYSWNGVGNGYGGPRYSKNMIMNTAIWGSYPSLGKQYRTSTNHRVFFGDWETWFLLAEGAVRGWNTNGIDAETAYNKGIEASFVYNGCTEFLADYLQSEDYNRVGTSVKFTHTTEPVAHEVDYIDGYTNEAKKMTYNYPDVTKILYKGGALNDQLTKIITQKYLAQMPYLPTEAWSDHRRLGLPFFEILGSEEPWSQMPDWNVDAYKSGQKVSLYPQRMKFPSSLQNADKDGYAKAVELLGGSETTLTPVWWSQGGH